MTLEEFYKIRKEVKKPQNISRKNNQIVCYRDEKGNTLRIQGNEQILIIKNQKLVLSPKNKLNIIQINSKSDQIIEYLKGISDDKMIEYCYSIAAFRKTGLLHNDSFIKEISEKFKFDSRATEELILSEAHERYKDVIKLLFCANPYKYLY